jgi:hypothetical protein
MTEWAVREALKRWGDPFEHVFETIDKVGKRVIRLEPKTASGDDPQ